MKRTITLEDIARYPLPGRGIPSQLAFSPDDLLITYLHSQGGGLERQLYAVKTATGERLPLVVPSGRGASEENLSLEEKLRRERQRQLDLGITSYTWTPSGQRLMMPLPDGLYIQDEVGQPWRKLVGTDGGPLLDPKFSPDGAWVAYVQVDELWLVSSAGGDPRQLTSGAKESGKTHGLAEYIAQEEMHRFHGFWWSPDSRRLAFEEVDEGHIPVYRILHQGQDRTGLEAQEDHRYPFAGQANAHVRLGVVSIDSGEPVWMDLGAEQDIYLARVNWLADGQLAVQIENRAQTHLDLLAYDVTTGQAQSLLREESKIWINLHDIFHSIKSGPYMGGFIWASERSGFRHLYLYAAYGQLLKPLTAGDWMVDELVGVNEANSLVYFMATMESPLESHLYRVAIDGKGDEGQPQRITQVSGRHHVILDHASQNFIDICSSTRQPPRISLNRLSDGAELLSIFEPSDPRLAELDLRPPELVSLRNRQGDLLYGAIYRPDTGSAPYPTLISVYGGPHAQMVTNSWDMTSSMRAQYLRQQGYLVFVMDNRGSARRGLKFESAIYHHMGDPEVQDQVDGVRWLVDQGLADPRRVGIYGWSYGGYMAVMSLLRAPETFALAVAGAPVAAWDGYDTHYTERYMGLPQENPDGYAASSALGYVEQMSGKLMLVHGLIDENVHFRHTARLVNALIRVRKTYELLLFPDERHLPRRLEDRVYMEQRIFDFIQRCL